MGLSEAFMKILPEMTLKDSNIGSVFLPLGKREDVSRYLCRADPDMNYDGIELFDIEEREGKYYEKPNWIDKYFRRDMSEWKELCLPQYVKMFDPISQNKTEKEENEDRDIVESEDDEISGQNFERDKAKYRVSHKNVYIFLVFFSKTHRHQILRKAIALI